MSAIPPLSGDNQKWSGVSLPRLECLLYEWALSYAPLDTTRQRICPMRINPFYDAWLFLTGQTGEHAASGIG